MPRAIREGCYSIEYRDPANPELRKAMDFDFFSDEDPERNRWTYSESPVGTTHWETFRQIPEDGYWAMLDHFGLMEDEMSIDSIVTMNPSPADIARIRRAKESRFGLERKVMENMRVGCPKHECADMFEAA